MSSRVSPSDRIHAEIDRLFSGDCDLVEVLEDVARLGARLIIQTALEAEVTEFLGRARYQRGVSVQDARPGSRNGYCPTTIKTTAGPVEATLALWSDDGLDYVALAWPRTSPWRPAPPWA